MLADMGVIGLTVPDGYGGFGEGPASRLVVQRELGRALVLEPVIPSRRHRGRNAECVRQPGAEGHLACWPSQAANAS